MLDIRDFLQACQEMNASDLHLVKGEPPIVRIDGHILRAPFSPMDEIELKETLFRLMDEAERAIFDEKSDVNFAVSFVGIDRFRVNVHRQRGAIEAAFRRMPSRIPTLHELGMPPVLEELARKPYGLVLVSGPVGMGKTTTLLSMVEQINHERDCMIITVEDPIEYIYTNKKSIIKQREVGKDTPSFNEALRNALRQDPNVIVISEMRDFETIAIALTAADTGHLVLATVHSPDTVQAIQRIINVFSGAQQTQVRMQLADVLQGIVSQVLLPKIGGEGRVPAVEVLIGTPAVRTLIREQKLAQLSSLLETGVKEGMQTRDKGIKDLVNKGHITCQTAMTKLVFPENFVCPASAQMNEWAAMQGK